MITIATFASATDAHIAQGILDENGIQSIITDETSAQVLSIPFGIGGIRVQVNDEDFDKAQEIIKQLDLKKL